MDNHQNHDDVLLASSGGRFTIIILPLSSVPSHLYDPLLAQVFCHRRLVQRSIHYWGV